MTIKQAERIKEALIEHMSDASPKLIADFFTPLSRLGVTSRMEIRDALFIMLADLYRNLVRANASVEQWKNFERYVEACSISRQQVLQSFFPDNELALLSQIQDDWNNKQRFSEFNRITDLRHDELYGSEPVGSFANFLHTLDPNSSNYWPAVYQRLGLPSPNVPNSPAVESKGSHPSSRGCVLMLAVLAGMTVIATWIVS